jgi:2-polyprenyl-6-methoxyphenol hydroxylase-like FAD-dependent oxidoreductase
MKQRIAIAGAGPVGLATALCLARAGHEVRVFEKRDALSTASRASTFHPPTLDMLAHLGVLDAVAGLGVRIDEIRYYRCNTGQPELAARFPYTLLDGGTAHPWRMHLEQSSLTPVLLAALAREPGARVEFDAAIEGFEEHTGAIEVAVRRNGGVVRETFGWLVGADGSKSTVREQAGIAFEGEDHEKRVLRVMTPLDLRTLIPELSGIAYLYNDGDSVSLLRMREVWRVIIRLATAITDDAALGADFLRAELARFLPIKGDLPVRSKDIYSTSRRIAARFRRGRVLLAGDAAHVTNTRGGMNMNCGLHDAWTLGRTFTGVRDPRVLDALLDTWARNRRALATDELIPRTDRSVGGGATFFAAVEASARDPLLAREFVRDAAMLDIAPSFA